jgi:hypothetical protein
MRRHFVSLLSQKSLNLGFNVSFLKDFSNEKYVFDGTSIFIRQIPEVIRRNKGINRMIKSVAKGAGAKWVKFKVRGWRIKIERGKPIALEYTCEKSVFVKDFEKFRKSLFENEDEVIVAVLKNGRWVEIKDKFTEECLERLREKIEIFNRKIYVATKLNLTSLQPSLSISMIEKGDQIQGIYTITGRIENERQSGAFLVCNFFAFEKPP